CIYGLVQAPVGRGSRRGRTADGGRQAAGSGPREEVQEAWAQLREQLEIRRQRIYTEIRAYPTPIPACDAQFNYLLEQRCLLAEDVRRFEAARAESQTTPDPAACLRDFVSACGCLDGEAKRLLSGG